MLYDPNGSAEAVARLVEAAGGTIVEGADPVALPKAKKSAAELAGARAAHLRDGVAMLRFLRFIETSAPGSLTEIDAAKALEKFRAETAAEGDMPLADLSFDVDLLHRPERRDQPLSRHRAHQPTARSRRALSDRFRRAVSRRHHRHHAHRADRRAAARAPRSLPRPLHARAEGPHRHRRGALPEGHDRRAARHARPHRALAGGPRLRPRHRPRRRRLPLGARGTAADLQDRPHAARARHDHLQRARLLPRRRFRHPHRESRRRARGGAGAGRRPADALLRDDHARADRPAADRAAADERRPRSPGSTPTTSASSARSPAGRR